MIPEAANSIRVTDTSGTAQPDSDINSAMLIAHAVSGLSFISDDMLASATVLSHAQTLAGMYQTTTAPTVDANIFSQNTAWKRKQFYKLPIFSITFLPLTYADTMATFVPDKDGELYGYITLSAVGTF